MNNELLAILEYIEQERGISKEQLVEAIEKGVLSASNKAIEKGILSVSNNGIHPTHDLSVKLDRRTGELKVWAKLQVVDGVPGEDQIALQLACSRIPDAQVGQIVEWEVTPQNFGRIAAQTARQAILTHLRKAEKTIVLDEFRDQVGEIVNGNVRRMDNGSIYVDFQKAEGVIGPKDRVPREQYMPGERINALLVKFNEEESGPCLILSRSSVNFVRKLFEREVSEIHDGIVDIMGIAREAGVRTKIAVRSNDDHVDPVGACVGQRGLRVKNITNELNGERIDVIRYEENLQDYLEQAMQPAKILYSEEDPVKKALYVHVDEENARLAFGKKGQNVRLAQKLLGWTIEIIKDSPEEEFQEQKAQAVVDLADTLAIDDAQAELLVEHGYLTIDGLKAASADDLNKIEGLTEDTLSAIENAIAEEGNN